MDHDDTVTEDSTHTQQELEEMMESLVTRMIKSEMEDFELVLKSSTSYYSVIAGVKEKMSD